MDVTLWMCLKVTPVACHLWIQRGKISPLHISEQIRMEADGERRVIFQSPCAMNHTHSVCLFRRSFFNLKKLQFVIKLTKCKTVKVRQW